MKFLLKDLVVTMLAVLGMLGSINWMDIPFWIYLLLLVSYGGLRLANKDNNDI